MSAVQHKCMSTSGEVRDSGVGVTRQKERLYRVGDK
jgi:hypothetical protein